MTTDAQPTELTPIRINEGAKIRHEEDKTEREATKAFDVTARPFNERWYFMHEHDWYSTSKGNGSPIIQLSFNFDGCHASGLGSRDDA